MIDMKSISFPSAVADDMVRATLDGRKTVTRRVVKPRYGGNLEVHDDPFGTPRLSEKCGCLCRGLKPPYRPGDILYVRETFSKERVRGEDIFVYKTGDENAKILQEVGGRIIKWTPSIHMPREAARIFLRVTDVRVERLQDITEEQVRAEGAEPFMMTVDVYKPDNEKRWVEKLPALVIFPGIWDRTIKPADRALYGWDGNPWVWAIAFERCEKPEGE